METTVWKRWLIRAVFALPFAAMNVSATEITHVKVYNMRNVAAETNAVTFGQLLKSGDVPAGSSLEARLSSGAAIPLQIDRKSKHADGSLRHAILTAKLPNLPQRGELILSLHRAATESPGSTLQISQLLAKNFTAEVNLDIGGTPYRIAVQDLLKQKAASTQPWLVGPLVTEWHLSARFKDNQGNPHPHLALKCAVRAYAQFDSVRLDFSIENSWAYAAAPQNYLYDVNIKVGEKTVFGKTKLRHTRQARWRKVFWWGKELTVQAIPDTAYLMDTGALPNYDVNQKIALRALQALEKSLSSPSFDLMANGLANKYMPTTGGRLEIGPLPQWAALLLISQDVRALAATLAMGDLSGSWPIHFRDEQTDRFVSLDDYPYMTLLGNDGDTINPRTNRAEKFPPCAGDCSSEFYPDSGHQPSFAYLPYVLTGDFYYLEELQFWANWNMLQHNPTYREFEKGLFKPDQIRGQAWSMRTLAQAAYITPDQHPQNDYFVKRVENNLRWYNKRFTQDPDSNKLGVLAWGYAFSYDDGKAIAPWQDDFFTWSVGHTLSLGFHEARPLVEWKSKFPVARMVAPDYCWIFAAAYSLKVREDKNSKRLYDSWAEIYRINYGEQTDKSGVRLGDLDCGSREMAAWLTQKNREKNPGAGPIASGEMIGYPTGAEGYPANMQPALATAVDAGIADAEKAWRKFISREIFADYTEEPQFAVVPRKRTKK